MDKALRNKVYALVINCKNIIEEDYKKQFESVYGIKPNKIESENSLNLSIEDLEKRNRILSKIDYLVDSGITKTHAFEKFLLDSAYTTLNRLAALKLMENFNITKNIFTKLEKSEGFTLFIRVCPLLASIEKKKTFDLYLSLLFDELFQELEVVFDRSSDESILYLGYLSMSKIDKLYSKEDIEEIWKDEETLGWIYQYFYSKEKEKVRDSTGRSKPKKAQDLTAINQFYTPAYVVRFIVDNTLGKYWKEMHPTSRIDDYCRFMIKGSNKEWINKNINVKSPTEINILDPACGSGHFLLYSFDVLEEIYKEAIKEGWIEPDLIPESGIHYSIIHNNLFGFDIDLRAIQICTLSLFLKLKKHDKNTQFPKTNLIAANSMLTHKRSKEVLRAKMSHKKDYYKFFSNNWDSIIHVDEIGSTMKIKEEIEQFVLNKTGTQKELGEFFFEDKQRIINFRNKFFKDVNMLLKTSGITSDKLEQELRANLRFIDSISKEYDIIVMNPPYGKSTPYGEKYLKKYYPNTGKNLLCAFIENSLFLVSNDGYVGGIFDSIFATKSTYTKFRENVLLSQKVKLKLFIDMRWGVLDGALVSTALAILEKSKENRNDNSLFVKLDENDNKELQLKDIVSSVNSMENMDSRIFIRNSSDFLIFPNSALAFSTPLTLLKIFRNPPLEPNLIKGAEGVSPANSPRFQRFFWEVENDKIGYGKKWLPYANGGSYSPFFRIYKQLVNWENGGYEIKNHFFPKGHKNEGKRRSVVRNEELYFQEGVSWPKKQDFFNAQYLPEGHIFSGVGFAAFPISSKNNWYILCLLNSCLVQYLLRLYCDLDKPPGYIGLLPYKKPSNELLSIVIPNTKEIIKIKEEWNRYNELSPDFKITWLMNGSSLKNMIDSTINRFEEMNSRIINLKDRIDSEILAHYGISKSDILTINEELASKPKLTVWDSFKEFNKKKIEKELVYSLLSYFVAILIGKLEKDEKSKLGVLIDDHDNPNDFIRKIEEFLTVYYEDDAISLVESVVGKNLRDYFRKDFFTYHFKKFKHRPFYWQLSIQSKKFSIWVYYLNLNQELLLKIKNEIILPKINFEEKNLIEIAENIEIAESNKENKRIKVLSKEKSEKNRLVNEIKDFKDALQEIINSNFPYEFDDGILINIAPFSSIIKEKKFINAWSDIKRGEYRWSSLSKHLSGS